MPAGGRRRIFDSFCPPPPACAVPFALSAAATAQLRDTPTPTSTLTSTPSPSPTATRSRLVLTLFRRRLSLRLLRFSTFPTCRISGFSRVAFVRLLVNSRALSLSLSLAPSRSLSVSCSLCFFQPFVYFLRHFLPFFYSARLPTHCRGGYLTPPPGRTISIFLSGGFVLFRI